MTAARWVTIKAATMDDAEALSEILISELGVSGGMAHSAARSDDLDVMVEFDPKTVDGGPAAIIAWCEGLGVEWSAEFIGWEDE